MTEYFKLLFGYNEDEDYCHFVNGKIRYVAGAYKDCRTAKQRRKRKREIEEGLYPYEEEEEEEGGGGEEEEEEEDEEEQYRSKRRHAQAVERKEKMERERLEQEKLREKELELNRALLDAASRGDVEQCRELLVSKADMHSKMGPRGQSPLHLAASNGKREVFSLFQEAVNDRDHRGWTPLHVVADDARCVEELVRLGARVREREDDADASTATALHVAVAQNKVNAVGALLKLGGDAGQRRAHPDYNPEKDPRCQTTTPYHLAIENGNLEICRLILEKDDTVCFFDTDGEDISVLTCMFSLNHADMLELFLPYIKKNVNACDYFGRTILCHAVLSGRTAMALALLEAGADINYKEDKDDPYESIYGDTPLHTAVREMDFGMCQLLLENGADSNLPNSSDDCPLHTLMRSMMETGRDIFDFQGDYADTYFRICLLLLEYGADPRSTDRNGDTPLSEDLIRRLNPHIRCCAW